MKSRYFGMLVMVSVLIIGLGAVVSAFTEENKSCSGAEDCRVTSCGYCVNINQEEQKFCAEAAYVRNYTLSCECRNNRCWVVKTMGIDNNPTCVEKSGSCCKGGACVDTFVGCPNGSGVYFDGCDKNCGAMTGCRKTLGNGRQAEIKIMPETASARAIERLGELNFKVELKEVGKGNETKAAYELTGNKQGKFLGIFKIMAKVKAQVDAETGDVKVIKPWWSFLTSGL